MASDKGAYNDALDERLAEVRDSLLIQGEEIIAQVEADQGQALVLTKFRVLVLKVGITATGTMNGQITKTYLLDNITAVNVRKGPMGAVIQIVTPEKEQAEPGTPPGNVVVFSDPRKAATCEAIAMEIEELLGKPVEKIGPQKQESTPAPIEAEPEPQIEPAAEAPVEIEKIPELVIEVEPMPALDPEPPAANAEEEPLIPKSVRTGRAKRSLADEIYAEVTGAEPGPDEAKPAAAKADKGKAAEQPPKKAAQEEVQTPSEPAEEKPFGEYNPNPRLPKPVVKRSGNNKTLVLVGVLLVMALGGIAVIAPLRMSGSTPPVKIDVASLTNNKTALQSQYKLVQDYRTEVEAIVKQDEHSAASLEGALRSGSNASIAAAIKQQSSISAWKKIGDLEAPVGLAGAKESIRKGMFIRRNAVASVASCAQSPGTLNASLELDKLIEADASISKGMDEINKMVTDLEDQLGISAESKAAK